MQEEEDSSWSLLALDACSLPMYLRVCCVALEMFRRASVTAILHLPEGCPAAWIKAPVTISRAWLNISTEYMSEVDDHLAVEALAAKLTGFKVLSIIPTVDQVQFSIEGHLVTTNLVNELVATVGQAVKLAHGAEIWQQLTEGRIQLLVSPDGEITVIPLVPPPLSKNKRRKMKRYGHK